VSRGISQGIETFFAVDAIFENLTIKADMNYTYTSSKIFDSGDYSGKPMIYIPRHRVGANLSVLFKQLNFFITTLLFRNALPMSLTLCHTSI